LVEKPTAREATVPDSMTMNSDQPKRKATIGPYASRR